MKGKKAKVNQIFSATVCLVVAFALAVFTCYAWFTSINNVSNGISASVSEGNIVNLAVNYYSLTGKTESTEDNVTTTTYTVGDYLGDDSADVPINAYGSTGSTITLIKVTYTVKDGTATKLIFSGIGEATFPAENVYDTDGVTVKSYSTSLSNAVSLRLAEISTDEKTFSTSNEAKTFCNVSELTSTESQTIDKNNIIFSGINGTQNTDSGYYDVTVYVVMEYSEENVAALYPSGATYSYALKCTKDISLVVKSNDSSDETDSSADSSSSDSSASDSSDSSSSSGENIGIDAEVNISTLVSNGTLSVATYDSDMTLYSGTDNTKVTVTASSSSTVSVDSNSKSIDGYSFTYRLKLGGAGSTTARSVKVETVGACTITVYAMSSTNMSSSSYTGSDKTRTLALYDLSYNIIDNSQNDDGSAITKYTYSVDAADTYYIASTNGGMNIYAIIINYT